ncbi:hypothetical protein [Paraburkholderia susongensis]|uniref:Uncharacterized protein n=1 Tax=Paraburkholderia susongensis TaxID=1515439 RepID=A0A1X7ICV6_9BURK|nr:hypothetical protein [Paraburkholderia susongensis]SMG12090.1 hypothetical protein SAMN06265784_101532 [Paraburkholderia susongensis]
MPAGLLSFAAFVALLSGTAEHRAALLHARMFVHLADHFTANFL